MYVVFTTGNEPIIELATEELDAVPSKGDFVQLKDMVHRQVTSVVWAYSKNNILIVAVGTREV